MRLNFKTLDINGLEWGNKTTVKDGTLYVNSDEAIEACGTHPYIESISLHIAHPGESIRIMPVKDVIEPRCKVTEEGAMFPGVVGELKQAGIGETLALKGAAVVITQNNDINAVCRTGGFIDMTGPASEFCPFSKLYNVSIDYLVGLTNEKKPYPRSK